MVVTVILLVVAASDDRPADSPPHGSPSAPRDRSANAEHESDGATEPCPDEHPDALTSPSQTPSPSPSIPTLPPIPAGSVQILYYHRVKRHRRHLTWSAARRRAFLAYDIVPSAFTAQLDWLQQNGYTTILPRDLAAHWDDRAALPGRSVILTFDDGFHDWASTVLPALRRVA